MKVYLEEVASGVTIEALITKAEAKEMPLKKKGWQFNWRQLSKTEGADFYKLTKLDTPEEIEGVLMITLLNEEMLYMNNIEVAPHNYGSNGKYSKVAGSLLAFACYKSFEQGKSYYLGYLSFDSKTSLIRLYQEKYGATLAMGQKMFFDPDAGKKLMKKYLKLGL
ncbi:MAG TPA: hypothetical protein PKA00_00265 [Saprospiraceae bacterium]|mgnify:CR=1 FL=1|nr:hypothetical protein [Saprospiraceae bacterium]HMQ81297.1 hypothetical protein [Saprospiraceae bacterium]